MGKRKKKHKTEIEVEQPGVPEPEPAAAADETIAPVAEAAEGEVPVEAGEEAPDELFEMPEETIARLKRELDEQKDTYLRLAAEFANFRNRRIRERSETWNQAQADLMGTLLDSIDDLARVTELDADQVSVADVVAGVDLVERKLLRELTNKGLERTGEAGERFDPNYHEAVATAPAPSEEQEDHVAMVLQVGYKMGKNLLRPARVQVYVEAPPDVGAEA
ncbi:MAG: nucleotide exchange factor GrpE [Gemmatimonadota bacterium]|nr:MAG: nucleotide exchange factor GrpE [Gemmatimonadota bacterium]